MGNFTVKDSGKREEFGTGAVRDTAMDKPRPDLISPFALIVVAGCWENNAVAIWAGIIFMFLYDAKPEMEIISRTKVYQDCKFNIIDGENHK